MKKLLLTGIGLAAAVAWSQGEVIWIEAENFAERGAWVVDTQFTHAMGSAYLIAPGVGRPIGAAKTTFKVAEAVRLTVTAVHGGDEVRVFEIRAE